MKRIILVLIYLVALLALLSSCGTQTCVAVNCTQTQEDLQATTVAIQATQTALTQPTTSPNNPTTSTQPVRIQYENLGVWSYWHTDGPYPQPPTTNSAIVAHGDILNDSNCHIKIFYSGNTVGNLGHGSFRLVKLTGGDGDAILQYVKDNIQSQLGNCPII